MRKLRSVLPLVVPLLWLACGDDSVGSDAGPFARDASGGIDAGMPRTCTSDGTILGDCTKFDCEVRNASDVHCAGTTSRFTFNCTGVDAFPEAYQSELRDYFHACTLELPALMDAQVDTTGGPLTVTACQQLQCAIKPVSQRMPAPMVIDANCAPVPSPACDFPDPPM